MSRKINIIKRILLVTLVSISGISLSLAQDDYWKQRVSLFEKLPVSPEDIVFLGNSITDGGEFQELFNMENVLNRGIRSDRIDGVRKRLTQVTSGKPKMIFLLIGINDIADPNNTVKSISSKYERLVKEIREQSPDTRLFIQSIMPVNNDFKRYKSLLGRQDMIPEVNEELKRIALGNSSTYIDLWPELAEKETGKMKREFTSDGLHLTGAGYKKWTWMIRPYIDGSIEIGDQEEISEEISEGMDEDTSKLFILNMKE